MVSGILNKIQLPLNEKKKQRNLQVALFYKQINLYKNILKDFYLNKKRTYIPVKTISYLKKIHHQKRKSIKCTCILYISGI